MWFGAGPRDIDRPQIDPGRREEAPQTHYRKIYFVETFRSGCRRKFITGDFMSLLVVGSIAFDGIETPHGKRDRMLGGAASYFALAASQFTPVRVVAIVGEDFTAKEKAIFHGRKIDLSGVEHAEGKSFFWAGRYSQNMNERTTLATELNVFANFKPTLPDSYLDSSSIFLGNIDPTLQRSVLKQVKGKLKVVGLD